MAKQSDPDHGERGSVLGIVRSLVPEFVRRRYTLKFAMILVVMVVVIGAMGVTATGMVSSAVEGNVEKEQRDLATQKANVVQKWVQRNSVSVKLASKNDALARTDEGSQYDMRGELATTGANLHGVNAVFLVDGSRDGMAVVASPQIPFGTDVSDTDRSWLLDVDVSRMGVAAVHISDVYKVDDRPVIAFLSPVQGTDDRYLVVEYDVRPLARSLQQTGSSSGFTQVVDESGTVQIAARSSEIDRPYRGDDPQAYVERADRIAETPGASAGIVARGGSHPRAKDTEYTVGYAPIQVDNTDLDWVVLIHEPTRNVYGFPQAISLWGGVATLAGVVLIGLLGGTIGYNTTRDIEELRRLAGEMRAGDLEVDVYSGRVDSIGKLYDAFDEMRVELKRQIEEANRAREDAERSRAVAMRTNQYLQEKAEEYSATMERCADGDLRRRMDADGVNEAMDRIAHDFNGMMRELERTTAQLKQFAAEVEATGEALESTAESVKVSSEHVAESVHTISDETWDQKERLESLSREIDDLVALFEARADEGSPGAAESGERLREIGEVVSSVAATSEQTLGETDIVAGAAEEQTAELTQVSQRAADLTAYSRRLRAVLGELETDADGELELDGRSETGEESVVRIDGTED